MCFCCICEIGVWCSPLLRDVPCGDTVQRCLKRRTVCGRICLDDIDFAKSWSRLTKLTVVRSYTFTLQKRFNVNKSIYEMRYVQDYVHLFISMPLCKYIFRFMAPCLYFNAVTKQFVSSTSIFGLLMDHIQRNSRRQISPTFDRKKNGLTLKISISSFPAPGVVETKNIVWNYRSW